jgi:hypothetical protein
MKKTPEKESPCFALTSIDLLGASLITDNKNMNTKKPLKIETKDLTFEFDYDQIQKLLQMREDGLTTIQIARAVKFEEYIPLHIKLGIVKELFASKDEL